MKYTKIPKELHKNFITVEGIQFAVLPIIMNDFSNFIVSKIGMEYNYGAKDILFLNEINNFWNKKEDKESCMKAVDDYLKKYNSTNIDPYELVIDAFN